MFRYKHKIEIQLVIKKINFVSIFNLGHSMASAVRYHKTTCKKQQCHFFRQFANQSQNGFVPNETHDLAKCNKKYSTVPQENQCKQTTHEEEEHQQQQQYSMECMETYLSAWQTFQKHRWKCDTDNRNLLCERESCCYQQDSHECKKQGLYQNKWLTENEINTRKKYFQRISFLHDDDNGDVIENETFIQKTSTITNVRAEPTCIIADNPLSHSVIHCEASDDTTTAEKCINEKRSKINNKRNINSKSIPAIRKQCCQQKYRFDSLKSQCNVTSESCRKNCFVSIDHCQCFDQVIDCKAQNDSRCHDCWKWNFQSATAAMSQVYVKNILRNSSLSVFNDLQKFLRAILPILLLFNMLPLLYAGKHNILSTFYTTSYLHISVTYRVCTS